SPKLYVQGDGAGGENDSLTAPEVAERFIRVVMKEIRTTDTFRRPHGKYQLRGRRSGEINSGALLECREEISFSLSIERYLWSSKRVRLLKEWYPPQTRSTMPEDYEEDEEELYDEEVAPTSHG
ncbi:hypothetical protein FOZ63_021136, partial [Perkinsus olseni]